MNLTALEEMIDRYTLINQYGGLPMELVGVLGGEVRISLELGKYHISEINRKLIGVDFGLSEKGLTIQLEMDEEGKNVKTTIADIRKATYDHGYGGHEQMGKFYMDLESGVTGRIFVGYTTPDSGDYQKKHFGPDSSAWVKTNLI